MRFDDVKDRRVWSGGLLQAVVLFNVHLLPMKNVCGICLEVLAQGRGNDGRNESLQQIVILFFLIKREKVQKFKGQAQSQTE